MQLGTAVQATIWITRVQRCDKKRFQSRKFDANDARRGYVRLVRRDDLRTPPKPPIIPDNAGWKAIEFNRSYPQTKVRRFEDIEEQRQTHAHRKLNSSFERFAIWRMRTITRSLADNRTLQFLYADVYRHRHSFSLSLSLSVRVCAFDPFFFFVTEWQEKEKEKSASSVQRLLSF